MAVDTLGIFKIGLFFFVSAVTYIKLIYLAQKKVMLVFDEEICVNDKKVCRNCGELKLLSSYTPVRSSADGYHGVCKSCRALFRREYVLRNKSELSLRLSSVRKSYYRQNKTNLSLSCCAGCGEVDSFRKQYVDSVSLKPKPLFYSPSTLQGPGCLVLCSQCLSVYKSRRGDV